MLCTSFILNELRKNQKSLKKVFETLQDSSKLFSVRIGSGLKTDAFLAKNETRMKLRVLNRD